MALTTDREELTAESEALLRHLAAQGYVMLAPVMDDLRAIEAAAEERAVARHVRETGWHEVPCCFSIHEFEQVCPRTGTTFMPALAAREEAPK